MAVQCGQCSITRVLEILFAALVGALVFRTLGMEEFCNETEFRDVSPGNQCTCPPPGSSDVNTVGIVVGEQSEITPTKPTAENTLEEGNIVQTKGYSPGGESAVVVGGGVAAPKFGLPKALRDVLHSWKSDPFMWHMPHGADKQRGKGIEHMVQLVEKLKEKCICPAGLMGVFVWTYGDEKGVPLVRQAYEACDCPYVQLNYTASKWDWFGKVGPVLDWMENGGGKDYTHFLVTDAEDVSFAKEPTNLIDVFEMYEAEIVFANTQSNWPFDEVCGEFESRVNPWSTKHQHLSAGGYMAKRETLMPYLKILREDYRQYKEPGGDVAYPQNRWGNRVWDDQLAWRRLHVKFYPNIQVDSLSLIFSRKDNVMGVI
ncbi:unnamed protein product [Choristocarpus tenellus]